MTKRRSKEHDALVVIVKRLVDPGVPLYGPQGLEEFIKDSEEIEADRATVPEGSEKEEK